MTTIRRFQFATAAAILVISQFAATQSRADIIYSIENHPSDQNGHSVSGLITTTDAAINDGYLVASEILGWEFAISGPTSTSVLSTNAGSFLQLSGDVLISANEITLEQPGIMSGFLNRIELGHSDGSRVIWHRDEFFSSFTEIYQGFSQNNAAWVNNSPSMSGTNPWLVATRLATDAVPEPSSLSLLGALTGLVLIRRSKSGN